MNNNKQQINSLGFSLIELMITMTIGLFLLAGLATSFISGKKASTERDQVSVLEDNGRVALQVISDVIERTGFTPLKGAPALERKILTDNNDILSAACTGEANNVVKLSLFTDSRMTGDNEEGDTITVGHYGDNNVFTDCGGNTLPVNCRVPNNPDPNGSTIYNSFFLDGDELKCVGSRGSKTVTIANNIENIQILYGVKSGINNNVDRFLNASQMTPELYNSVLSIQVAVLVKSDIEMKQQAESVSYTLLDQSITSPNDKYKRAVFNTTIRIRNTL